MVDRKTNKDRRLRTGLLKAELALLRHDRLFVIGSLFALLLALYATFGGMQWQGVRGVAHAEGVMRVAAAIQREATQLGAIESGELAISDAAAAGLPHVVGTEFALPPTAISGLAIGDAELRPTYASISATTRMHEMFRFQEVDNPVLLGWGRFDLAFVVIYLLPLLIAGFGCVALSADHESRVLQIVLSQPVSARRLATLRVILRGSVLVLATLLGLASGLLLGQADLTASVDHLAWFIAIILFYSVFWGAVALWIISFGRSSETNALMMVIVWAVIVLIAPAINTFIAREISPMPSRLEYIVATREAENAANRGGRELLQNYLLDHPELEATRSDAVSPFIKTFFLVQREVERVIEPIVARFAAAENAQERTRQALRWVSPRDLASESLLWSTGNSVVRFADFERQARDLRADWLRAVESAVVAGRRLTADEFSQLPRPEFREVARAEFFQRHASSVFVLLLFSIIVSFDAFRRLKKFSSA